MDNKVKTYDESKITAEDMEHILDMIERSRTFSANFLSNLHKKLGDKGFDNLMSLLEQKGYQEKNGDYKK